MNILVLNYEFPPLGGGAAPVSRDLAFEFAKRGHHVVVLTMGYPGLAEYEERNGVHICRLRCRRKRKDACAPWEQYSYLTSVKKFMRIHKELQGYDVCHAHFVVPTGEAAYQIYQKYHIPYVVTAHESDVEGHNKKKSMVMMHRILRRRWRDIANHASSIVSPSLYLKQLMVHNYKMGRYVYIPNGIDTKRYKALNSIKWKEKRILVMGRLQQFKNVQMILEAISKTALEGWRVDILGDGPYRKELEAAAEKLQIAESVYFHGWIENNSHKQLDFLKHASLYISASRFENCPMAVIEAVLAGCRPLLSDIPAHRQLFAEKELFFQLDNTAELALKIRQQIKRGICRQQYGLDWLDWSAVFPQYEEKLKEAGRGLR